MPTGVRTDTNKDTLAKDLAEETTEVMPLVETFSNNQREDLWKLTDRALEYAKRHMHYTVRDIGEPTRRAYCRHHKIQKGNKDNENADYHNFTEWISKISYIAWHFKNRSDKEYDNWRRSGKGIYHVFAKLKESYKEARAKKLTANETKDGKWLLGPQDVKSEFYKAKLAAEAKEGVVNAKELEEATINKKKKKENPREESKGWTSPKVSGGYNMDKDLMKQNKQLYIGEPGKFFLMVARIITADTEPISPKWQAWRMVASQEMKAYEKELAK